jgi:hypothetical protein
MCAMMPILRSSGSGVILGIVITCYLLASFVLASVSARFPVSQTQKMRGH